MKSGMAGAMTGEMTSAMTGAMQRAKTRAKTSASLTEKRINIATTRKSVNDPARGINVAARKKRQLMMIQATHRKAIHTRPRILRIQSQRKVTQNANVERRQFMMKSTVIGILGPGLGALAPWDELWLCDIARYGVVIVILPARACRTL